MRILGILLFLGGCTATAISLHQAFRSSRPRDLLFAVLAPLCALLAIVGLILVFVPGFLG